MHPSSYRRFRPSTLIILAFLTTGIWAWQLHSGQSPHLDAGDGSCLALLLWLVGCDGRGLFTLRGRLAWPAVVFLLAALAMTFLPLYVLVYLWCCWRDGKRDPVVFHRLDLRTTQRQKRFPLCVYDNVVPARRQLVADRLEVWRHGTGKWQVEWPPILSVQSPRSMPNHPGETHLRFVVDPAATTGYVVVLCEFAADDELVVLELFTRTV